MGEVEIAGDFGEGLFLEVALGDEVAVEAGDFEESGVEGVLDVGQVVRRFVGSGIVLGGGAKLVGLAAEGLAAGGFDEVVGGCEEPRGEEARWRGLAGAGLFEQEDHGGLGDVLGGVGIAGLP